MTCEKCWRDAGGEYDAYLRLIAERKDHPCTPEEQAGQWWDADRKIDRRTLMRPARSHSEQ